jgi:hypothetical protein
MSLKSVHFVDAHTGCMVGAAIRDGGTDWEPQNGGTDKYHFCMLFADARRGAKAE